MARTSEGAALTVQHRNAQIRLRARTLQDFIRLWPLWQGDEATFDRLAGATIPLVQAHHRLSAAVAAAYYDSFRRAERVAGSPTPRLADSVNPERVMTSLHVTGRIAVRNAIVAGHSPQAAMQTALVRTSGAVTRHALTGGRDTLVLSAFEDSQAVGYSRVTSSRCCAFCAMLASRGPVYRQDTADFQAHDHCACSAEPSYEGSEWPGRGREFQALWREHATGGNQLQSFRRALEAA